MKKHVIVGLAVTAGIVSLMSWNPLNAEKEKMNTEKEIVPEQVVLYTIYKGEYEKLGVAIGQLFATAGQHGLFPTGDLTCAYLNNPEICGTQHALTEIRLPVPAEALSKAGTLGPYTDIKKIPALKVITAIKPIGQESPEQAIIALYETLRQENLMALEGFYEVILENGQTGNYTQMKSKLCLAYALAE